MNKKEFIEAMSEEVDCTKKEAEILLQKVGLIVCEHIALYGEALIPGVGKFSLKRAKARMGRNPKTGEHVAIPARNKLIFSPSKDLRNAVPPAAE
jgi:DNA-binding protein HU-beta